MTATFVTSERAGVSLSTAARLCHASTDEPVSAGQQATWRSWLSDGERARLDRFRGSDRRHEFLVTRALVRVALSRHAPLRPEEWRFVTGEHGRPAIDRDLGLPGGTALHFNLSNTHGLVVCLVAATEVGVDVEHLDRPLDVALADRYLSAAELAALRSLPLADQPRRFLEYWTLKESYLKGRGLGLALPLAKFGFELDGKAPPRLTLDPSLTDDAHRWRFVQLQLSPRHLVAAALQRTGDEEPQLLVERVDLG
jgi:4'-phosphopantetheinyl transferase